MRGKIFLVQWNEARARERAQALESEGWTVEWESADGGAAYRRIRLAPPDVVLVDCSTKASHGREVGRSLREAKSTRETPILLIDCPAEAQQALTAAVRGAVAIRSDELSSALEGIGRGPGSSPARRVDEGPP